MDAIRVAVVNGTHLDDDDVRTGVRALQAQLDQDFGPAWQVDATLEVVPSGPSYSWQDAWGLVLLDRRLRDEKGPQGEETEQSLALRTYEDAQSTPGGHPLASVFVDDVATGEDWTHLASHELLEVLIDPDGRGAVFVMTTPPSFHLYAKRVCDPCAAHGDGYERYGRQVCNFVHPAWFGGATLGHTTTFDQQGSIDGPFQTRPDCSIKDTEIERVALRFPWPP